LSSSNVMIASDRAGRVREVALEFLQRDYVLRAIGRPLRGHQAIRDSERPVETPGGPGTADRAGGFLADSRWPRPEPASAAGGKPRAPYLTTAGSPPATCQPGMVTASQPRLDTRPAGTGGGGQRAEADGRRGQDGGATTPHVPGHRMALSVTGQAPRRLTAEPVSSVLNRLACADRRVGEMYPSFSEMAAEQRGRLPGRPARP